MLNALPTSWGILDQDLHDFLFDRSYPQWLVVHVLQAHSVFHLKNSLMGLHMGEGVVELEQHSWVGAKAWQGQQLLFTLAEHLLNAWQDGLPTKDITRVRPKMEALLRSLELDGYLLRNGRLLTPETEVLDAEEEAGLLQTLYTSLGLENKEMALKHLSLSEEHYQQGRWTDCITNSRSFLEAVLREVAAAHSQRIKKQPLPDSIYKWAGEVRKYLRDAGLIDEDEMQALAKVYGLLSGKGSHPYMAESDQARLLRHLALVLSQFVLLRLDGLLN